MDQSAAQRRRERIVDESLKQIYGDTAQDCMPERLQMLLDAIKQEQETQAKEK